MKKICSLALVLLVAALLCTAGFGEAGVLYLPEGVTSIEARAFLNNTSVSEIILPEGLVSIGAEAFAGSSLAAINLPSSILEIGDGIFEGCGEIIVETQAGSYADRWCLANAPDSVRIAGRAAILEVGAEQTSAHSICLSWTVDAGDAVSLSYDVLLSRDAYSGYVSVGETGESSVEIGGLEQGATYYCMLKVSASENLPTGEIYEYTLVREGIPVTLYDADYDYLIKDGKSSVEGVALWEDGETTELTIPAQLGGCPVVRIGKQAFTGLGETTKVTLPDTVETIDSTAFYGCGALSAVEMGNSVTGIGAYAFAECPELSQMTLPDSIVSIGDHAFFNDAKLTGMELPEALESIGSRALWGTGVEEIMLPDGLKEIGVQALGEGIERISTGAQAVYFQSVDNVLYTVGRSELVCIPRSAVGAEYVAPAELEVIRACAFSGCEELESVVLSSNTRIIGESAFENCTSLARLGNAQGLTSIGDRAFYGCTLLNGDCFAGMTRLESVGGYAFGGCAAIERMEFPESLDRLGPAAFHSCTGLTGVSLPQEMSVIGDAAFYGCASLVRVDMPACITDEEGFGVYLFYECSSLGSIVIPEGVTAIGDYSFYKCTNLASASLPAGLETIDFAAFFSCKALEQIEIPESVAVINTYAFSNCAKLTEVNIPACAMGSYAFGGCSSLTAARFAEGGEISIPANAFYGCSKLAEVYLPENVEDIDAEAFAGCKLVTLYVVEGSFAHDFAVRNGFAFELM